MLDPSNFTAWQARGQRRRRCWQKWLGSKKTEASPRIMRARASVSVEDAAPGWSHGPSSYREARQQINKRNRIKGSTRNRAERTLVREARGRESQAARSQ